MSDTTVVSSEKITCELCGAKVHAIQIHLRSEHPEISLEQYQEKFPDAPILSALARQKIEEAERDKRQTERLATESEVAAELAARPIAKPFGEVFNLGKGAATKRADGSPIMIDVMPSTEWDMMIPAVDNNYIFNVDILKTLLLGFHLAKPVYLWGHAGVGKTTILEQICARTHRPMIRVQHTGSMEESHIVGQMVASPERGTEYSPGPLALAMKYGWTYLADEYDFAFPQVLSVYQAILEGKPLIIKDAPSDSEWRVVVPHPNFRFVATGNTNGSGDDTGLYQGTNIQNAANYERFFIVEQMPYMDKKQEAAVVAAQANVNMEDAQRLVAFAGLVREAFDNKKISATIGPRVLINAAINSYAKMSAIKGISLSFLNRLTPNDRQICMELAKRVLAD